MGITTLSLELKPSRILLFSLTGGHGLALLAVLVCVLPGIVKTVLVIAIGFSLLNLLDRFGRALSPHFVHSLEWNIDNTWQLQSASGELRSGELVGCYLHPHLLLLRFVLEQSRYRSILLLPDSAAAENIRRLRARLLWLRENRELSPDDGES